MGKKIDKIINKINKGNSVSIMKKIPDNSIDLVVTSPPYDDLRDYNNIITWDFIIFQKIAKQLFRVMKKGGVIVWIVGDKTDNGGKTLTSYKQALYFQKLGFKIYDVIIYEKSGSGPPHSKRYFNSFEYMFVLSKGKPKTVNLLEDKKNSCAGMTTFSEITRREKDGTLTNKGRKTIKEYGVRTNIWRYNNGKGFSTRDKSAYLHPAIFPEQLVKDHILSWSNPGDIVLDPFGGSGTTAKVSIENDRKWIYIDVVEDYCKIAEERILGLKNNGDADV